MSDAKTTQAVPTPLPAPGIPQAPGAAVPAERSPAPPRQGVGADPRGDAGAAPPADDPSGASVEIDDLRAEVRLLSDDLATALAEHRKLRALLVRLQDDSVMEDGFMTAAVGHRLLALGKVARELLQEVPER